MLFKLIGAIIVLLSCAGFGFFISAKHKKEIYILQELIRILDFMECELQYHMTPLPDLCRQAAQETKSILRQIFLKLSQELNDQYCSSVSSCMEAVLNKELELPYWTYKGLEQLGSSLGRFDLDGQLKALEETRNKCRLDLAQLDTNKEFQLRGYQTLSLCAGAALVILFI